MNVLKTISPKSDQLNADDLITGSKIIKITAVKVLEVPMQPMHISFENDNNKPYKPSLGMRRVIVQLWGEEDTEFIGKSLMLFRDEAIKFGSEQVGGIRISHASGITEPIRVLETVSKGKRRAITIYPLGVDYEAISDVEALAKLNACTNEDELITCYVALAKGVKKLPTVVALKESLKLKFKS